MNKDRSIHPPAPHDNVRQLILDVACCAPDHYCPLKEILIRAPRDPRSILQIKCLDQFKYERSESAGHDIQIEGAMNLWISEGHAASFASHYREGIRLKEIYALIMRDFDSKAAQPPMDE